MKIDWFWIFYFSLFLFAITHRLEEVDNNIEDIKIRQITDTVTVLKYDTVFTMRATGYYPVKGQTDNSPYKTACGMRIDKNDPISSRIIALPQHMIKNYNKNAPFNYGDSVQLTGDFPHQGVWIIGDCTNKRNTNVIDICMSNKDPINMWNNIYLRKSN